MRTIKGKTVILCDQDLSANGYNTNVTLVELKHFKQSIIPRIKDASIIIYRADHGFCKVLKCEARE